MLLCSSVILLLGSQLFVQATKSQGWLLVCRQLALDGLGLPPVYRAWP